MRKSDKQIAVRLTPEAKGLLLKLAAKLGVTNTSVIEMAIRRFAELNGVELSSAEKGEGGDDN